MKKVWMWLLLLSVFLWSEGASKATPLGVDAQVKQLLVKMIKANGAEVAAEKLKSLRVAHSVEMTGMGMKMEIELFSTTNSGLLVSKMNGMEMARQGFDGKEAWSKDMMMGLRVLDGQERLTMMQATLLGNYNPLSVYDQVFLGKEDNFKGKKVVELIGKKDGLPNNHYYVDSKTWLVAGNRTVQSGPQGEIPALIVVEEYQTLKAGFKYPSTMSIYAGPMKMTMKAVSFKENPDLTDIEFSKPKG